MEESGVDLRSKSKGSELLRSALSFSCWQSEPLKQYHSDGFLRYRMSLTLRAAPKLEAESFIEKVIGKVKS